MPFIFILLVNKSCSYLKIVNVVGHIRGDLKYKKQRRIRPSRDHHKWPLPTVFDINQKPANELVDFISSQEPVGIRAGCKNT